MSPMGMEAECTCRVGRKTSAGKALLEGERLIFRGDFRLEIPFEGLRNAEVDGGALVLTTEEQEARFELGAPVADRWLRLIREPKSLFEKLEVGPQSRVAVVDVVDSVFLTALRERTASVVEGRVPEGAPTIFLGAETKDALRKLPLVRARMADAGALWIVRPKGSKAISEADVYEAVRAAAMSDTKVVAFSKTHTAHKCVIPVELRGQPIPRPPILSVPPSAPSMAGKPGVAKPKSKPSKVPPRPSARPAARAKAKKNDVAKPKQRRR
jgi:hypothetical protein